MTLHRYIHKLIRVIPLEILYYNTGISSNHPFLGKKNHTPDKPPIIQAIRQSYAPIPIQKQQKKPINPISCLNSSVKCGFFRFNLGSLNIRKPPFGQNKKV
jgi:hypothetical protein